LGRSPRPGPGALTMLAKLNPPWIAEPMAATTPRAVAQKGEPGLGLAGAGRAR